METKTKNIEIVPSIFSDQNNMKLEISHMKRNEKKSDYMETKQHVTKKPISQQWNQRGNKKIKLRQMTMKTESYKIYGMQQKQLLEESS